MLSVRAAPLASRVLKLWCFSSLAAHTVAGLMPRGWEGRSLTPRGRRGWTAETAPSWLSWHSHRKCKLCESEVAQAETRRSPCLGLWEGVLQVVPSLGAYRVLPGLYPLQKVGTFSKLPQSHKAGAPGCGLTVSPFLYFYVWSISNPLAPSPKSSLNASTLPVSAAPGPD